MKGKKFFIIWNKRTGSWVVNPPKKLRKHLPIPCPHCQYHIKKKNRFHLKKKILGIRFMIGYDLDENIIKLEDWVCVHCSNKLDFDNFPQEIKNFFNNLFLRDLITYYLKPSLLILKIKSGKEFSGKALETGVTYKTSQRSVIFICGNCKNKNQFQIVKSKNRNTYQCLNCGKINVLHTNLFDFQSLPTE